MSENTEDIRLLWDDPGELLLKYRPLAETVVQMRINAGVVRREEKQEYVHYILDAFAQRIPSVREQYSGEAMLRTYCAAIFKNLCKDKVRADQRSESVRLLRDSDTVHYASVSPLSDLAIREEVEIFGRVFNLFTKKKAKAKLFLKVHFRIPIIQQDILDYYPEADKQDVKEWEKDINACDEEVDVGLYRVLSKISSQAEGKEKTADSIRKWIRARLNDLERLMNTSRISHHTEETLQILAERYFYTTEILTKEPMRVKQG